MKPIFTLSLVSPFLSNVSTSISTSTSTHYRSLVAYSLKQQKYRNTQRRSLSSHTPDDTSLDHVTNDDDDGIDASSLLVVDQIINQKSSFRRHRVKIANQLLIEYDRTAFGGLLLLQPQEPMSSTTGTIPPNVIIQWSNRLRTTAGRAHLLLHRPMMRDKKKSSQNEHILHMELRQTQRQTNAGDDHSSNVSHDTVSVLERSSSLPQGVRRTAIVELSTKVVDDELRLQTTLLHELCHVAAWMVDGNVKPPHGPYFQKWVNIVTNTIQPTIPITTKHTFEIHYKYAWECINPSCSVTLFRRHNRRSIDIQRHVCGKCRGPLREINTTPSHSNSCSLVDDTIIRVQNDSTTKRINHPTTRQRRPLTEYHRFIQTHTKRVTKQLLQQQRQQQKLKQSSTNTATTRRKQTQIKKVSPQKVMKECAKLWQLYKKNKTTGK